MPFIGDFRREAARPQTCPGSRWLRPTRAGAALALLLAPAAAQAAPSHCTSVEQTVFACRVPGRKIVSVCAHDLTEKGGLLQYRFGRRNAPDLRVPAAAGDDWRAITKSGTLTFSGGGGAFLSFSRPPFRYVVYTGIGRGWGEKAGVVVERAGKRVSSLKCAGAAQSELGPDLFKQGGLADDPQGFDLP